MCAAQMVLDRFGDVAQVRYYADSHALRLETETHWIDRVVRHAKALHLDVTDLKTGPRLERFETRLRFTPLDRRRSQARHEDRRAKVFVARQHRQSGDVVGMFVGMRIASMRASSSPTAANRLAVSRILSPASSRMRVFSV